MKSGDEFLWRECRIVTHPGARPRVPHDLSVCGPVNLPFFFVRPQATPPASRATPDRISRLVRAKLQASIKFHCNLKSASGDTCTSSVDATVAPL